MPNISPEFYENNAIRWIPRLINGIPVDFWQRNIKSIEDVIKRYKLKPVPRETLPGEFVFGLRPRELEVSTRGSKASAGRVRWPQFPGGIRVPHLHYKAELYMLDDKQWRVFSGRIVKGLQARLADANSVNFDQTIELSKAIDSL